MRCRIDCVCIALPESWQIVGKWSLQACYVDVSFSQMLFNRGSQLRHTETGNSLHRILYIVCEISVLAIQRELWRIDSGEIALRREPEYAIGSGPAIFPSLYVGD